MPALPVIEALNPLKDRCPRLFVGAETVLGQELALQGGKEAFHHRVIETVADRPHRRIDPRCRTPLTEEYRGVLATMIGVMNQPRLRPPLSHRHLQRRQDEVGAQMVLHRPADHPPAEHVKNHRQEEKPVLLGRQIRDVRDPEPVGTSSGKAPLDEVGSRRGRRIAPRGAHRRRPPTMAAHQPGLAHEPRHPVVPAGQPPRPEFRLDPQRTMELT